MKRIFPLILILLLLLSACGKEEAEQTVQRPADPVQTTGASDSTSVSTIGGAEGPEGILTEKDTETVYRMTRLTVLEADGSEVWHREYEYNELGQLAEELEYAGTGDLSYRTVCTYDEAGLCVSKEIFTMDSADASKLAGTQIITYSYNEQGQPVLEQCYEDDVLVSYNEYTYDHQGNYLTYKMYFGGELLYDWSYRCTYDEAGNLLTREEYMDGALAYRLECAYDEAGRCTENTTYNFEGTVEARATMTWEGSTETKIYYNMENQPVMTTVTTYDDHGNITFQENQYADGTSVITEYTYEPFEIKK